MNDVNFDQLIVEIFQEFTEINSEIGPLYFKHFSFLDTKKISLRRSFYYREAIQKGLSTEEEILKVLFKDKIWEESSEEFIKSKRAFIDNLKKSLSKIQIPSQRENHKKLIEMEESKLSEKEQERKSLIGITAESYAENKCNSEFLNSIVYIDQKMTKLLVDEIDDHTSILQIDISKMQADFFKRFSDTSISKMVLSDEFSPIFNIVETPEMIFGKPLKDMTSFQVKVFSYARSFLNIFKNCTKEIPSHVAKNPDLLIEFYEAQKNESKKQSKAKQGEGATTYFGANKNDIDMLANDDEKPISLSNELKKHGGKLDMQEMMKLHGV